jgi:hypothetical protein
MRFLTFCLVLLVPRVQAQLPTYTTVDFGTAHQGYYFITTQNYGGGGTFPIQGYMIDGAGDLVFRQHSTNMLDFRVWPDGRMTYSTATAHIIMDSTFTIIDSVKCVNGILTDHHDVQLLPNGHFLMLGGEILTMDLSSYFVFGTNNVAGSPNAIVRSGVVQELDENKNLLWEWHQIDHQDFLETDTSRLGSPSNVDWSHVNAAVFDDDGNVLLSSRNFNQIAKIDRNSDTIIWRLGGSYSDFDFTNDPGFFLQHDVRRIANGNITLYDNSAEDAHPCRGVEYELDEVDHTATAVWSRSYDAISYAPAMGSMQRLDNGNSLISWGTMEPGNATFTVYRPDSTRVCELFFPDTIASYRAYYFDDLPFTLHRPQITCQFQDPLYLLTATGGASFEWSTGATGPSILAAADDTVYVEVPTPSGGFLRSEPFVPADHCLSTGVAPTGGPSFSIYPNPAGSFLHVTSGAIAPPTQLELLDPMGRILSRIPSRKATWRSHSMACRPAVTSFASTGSPSGS